MFKRTRGELITEQGYGYVLAYKQYSDWTVTSAFETPEQAMSHSKLYLENDEIKDDKGVVLVKDSKAHITEVRLIKIDINSGIKLK